MAVLCSPHRDQVACLSSRPFVAYIGRREHTLRRFRLCSHISGISSHAYFTGGTSCVFSVYCIRIP
jgi:hypothetical protein